MAEKQQTDYGSIPPALTSEQWERRSSTRPGVVESSASRACADEQWAETIALCNALLPADSRSKFGWDYVDRLRQIAAKISSPLSHVNADAALADEVDRLVLLSLADVVASYLSPRDK